MSEFVKDHHTLKLRAGVVVSEADQLAVEEPLEIRLGGRRFTLTMRTPGHDEELAAGFLLAEGFINSREELAEIRRLRDSRGRPEPNALDLILKVPSAALRERLQRNFTISSSCGVCGKTSIEALQRRIPPLKSSTRLSASALFKMPAQMREAQAVFSATGGLHAAALFELGSEAQTASELAAPLGQSLIRLPLPPTHAPAPPPRFGGSVAQGPVSHPLTDEDPIHPPDSGKGKAYRDERSGEWVTQGASESSIFSATGGPSESALHAEEDMNGVPKPSASNAPDQNLRLIVLREDVGRHNAVDKVLGYALMHNIVPLHCSAMMVSGRLSFEIVQKAAAAGIAILCAVSAPSSLAVELAEEVGMTVVGFLRGSNLNIYTGQERIIC